MHKLRASNSAAAKLLQLDALLAQQGSQIGQLAKTVDRLHTRVRVASKDFGLPVKQVGVQAGVQAQVAAVSTVLSLGHALALAPVEVRLCMCSCSRTALDRRCCSPS